MAAHPPDPFAPPDLQSQEPLELTLAPQRPRPVAAPEAAAEEAAMLVVAQEASGRNAAPGRKPVAYKNPDGGAPRLILWLLAAIGLGAVVIGGAKYLSGQADPPPAPIAAAAAPAPPIKWNTLGKADEVLVTITVEPKSVRNVRLLLDGGPLPSNPVALPRGSQHTITAMADGFEPATAEVAAAKPANLRLQLRRK